MVIEEIPLPPGCKWYRMGPEYVLVGPENYGAIGYVRPLSNRAGARVESFCYCTNMHPAGTTLEEVAQDLADIVEDWLNEQQNDKSTNELASGQYL